MSNKSGTSEQIISLPKGGGALSGIGETFSPDLYTGTGNFTVPIALPSGRNGFQPELNLVYSTGNGNGPFGLGWNLSIPGVGRKTSKGVPRYNDEKDAFILSGAEDLVPVESEPDRTRYQPRTEGLFALIDRHHDPANDYWEVKSKDGLASLYGTPNAAGADPAVIADPAQRHNVFAWKLTETRDPFGNRIVYDYLRDSDRKGPHHWDQLYLERIRYVDYEDEAAGEERFLISVTFEYGEADERPDPFSEYRPGFEIRTRRRCQRIVVRTHADTERLVRTYDLVYLDEQVAAGELPASALLHNGISILSEIRVTGHGGDETETLPPLTFGYTHFEPEGRDFFPLTGRDIPAQSLASSDTELADLFGNGLPDFIQMNGVVRYWRNLGGGRFDLPRSMDEAPAGLALADPGIQLIDANGDGRIDLLAHQNGLSGYFPLQHNGEWDRRSFQRARFAPSFSLADPQVKLVDLNGDGVTDAIRSGSRLECFFNDPHNGWEETRQVERRAVEAFPNVDFSDPRVKWGDISGDGLQDIVLVYDGNIEYWPNLGHGNWAPRIHMHNSPRFPYGYRPEHILIGDVDGDGLADLIYVDHCQVFLYLNRSGNGWSSDPIIIDGTPPVSDMDAVRLVDMLGSGIAGVLWSRDTNGTARDNYFFLDFTGGIKPYLLNEMDNHMGAVTRVEYAPSTRYFLTDQENPTTRWQTTLPFPVQVVARIEVIDELSQGKLTTEYHYHHGYWDGAEREFRGFGMVEQSDTEVFADYNTPGLHGEVDFSTIESQHFSPPTLTKTWFHQGPIGEEFGEWLEADYSHEYWADDPQMLERPSDLTAFLRDATIPRLVKRDALRTLRGRVLRTELYALNGRNRQGRPYTMTEAVHSLREEAPPPADQPERPHIFFPFTVGQRTTQWERGDDSMTQFSFSEEFDDFGQPQKQTQIACPRGWRRLSDTAGEPFLVTQTRVDYARPVGQDVYIMDRPARTTRYEITNSGSTPLLTLKETPPGLEIIGQTINHYDGEAFTGRPAGEVGRYGALVRTGSLVLTEAILHETYKSGNTVTIPPELPPYLEPDGGSGWTPEYPAAFRDTLPALAGYVFYAGDAWHERGYFRSTSRQYDVHRAAPGRGLLQRTRDPLGHDTHIEYDGYDLLPTLVTNAVGLTTQAAYDYRVLQPRQVTDPNGNRQSFGYTPLGLPAWIAVKGKAGEGVGDTDAVPGARFDYDFLAFMARRQPVSVRTTRREHHVNDTDVPLSERDQTIETVEYSDGFGRLLQTRTQAEDVTFGDAAFGGVVLPADQAITPGDAIGHRRDPADPPNVIVSGWQTYNNKGQVIEQYEPFFDAGWDYDPPSDAQLGQKATMFYDPRGQVIRTVNPDGSEQQVIYGVPDDLADPTRFTPTPWEAYTYDANDNAGRTHPSEALGYETHWNTPASIVIDALGRTVEAVERNGRDPSQWYTTRSAYDIRGNLLSVTDALGREAFTYAYDLTYDEENGSQVWRIENIDAGLRRMVLDAAGNEIERRDSKGAFILQAYDLLHRRTHLWARDASVEAVTLRERLLYGDSPDAGLSEADAQGANLRGRLYRHYDEAGRLTLEAYDFKGNVQEKMREVFGDSVLLAVLEGPGTPFRVDWQTPDGSTLDSHADVLLNGTGYRTSATYDALSRVKEMRYPEDVEGARAVLRPLYNRAGALEQVMLDADVFVDHIAYNAKGQRTLIAYGNGVMTRYAYDPQTFRLMRLRSERYTKPDPTGFTYERSGAPLQDFGYAYDLAGNITTIHDRTPDSGLPAHPDHLDRAFSYDPLYRLSSATGRECDTPSPAPPWEDTVRCQDVTRTRFYSQTYFYDPLGNMDQLRHTATGGSFTRTFTLVPDTNRLATLGIGNGDTHHFNYAYDDNGNLTREATSRHFEWDHSDRMKAFRTQAGTAEPSIHAHYLYDASGQRVMKFVRRQGGQYDVRVYIDSVYEHYRWDQRSADARQNQNNQLHIMDDQRRIALVCRGPAHLDDTGPAVQFQLGDHLGSSNLVINSDGSWTNREEFTPYGETSFGSSARKRYRFTGQERDEESGLNYHKARYYAPWLGKWLSADPKWLTAEPKWIQSTVSLFVYVSANPLRNTDRRGEDLEDEIDDVVRQAEELGEEAQGLSNEAEQISGQIRFKDSAIRLREAQIEAADRGEILLSHRERTMLEGMNRWDQAKRTELVNRVRAIEQRLRVLERRARNLGRRLTRLQRALPGGGILRWIRRQVQEGFRTIEPGAEASLARRLTRAGELLEDVAMYGRLMRNVAGRILGVAGGVMDVLEVAEATENVLEGRPGRWFIFRICPTIEPCSGSSGPDL